MANFVTDNLKLGARSPQEISTRPIYRNILIWPKGGTI